MSSGLNPSKIRVDQLPDGGAVVTLPNGRTRRYTEAELGEMTIAQLQQCDLAPGTVDEAWLEILQRCVGEDRWNQAVALYASMTA